MVVPGPTPTVQMVSMLALEELHGALVLLGCGSAGKSAEVASATGTGIDFS
jgi:hypothetical protein